MSNDKIYINDLALRCVIGINSRERNITQDVIINLILYTDLTDACHSDNIDDTINYKHIKDQVCEVVENSNFFLIEKLAQVIADTCLKHPRVQKVNVKLSKPGALRFAKEACVEITRSKKQ